MEWRHAADPGTGSGCRMHPALPTGGRAALLPHCCAHLPGSAAQLNSGRRCRESCWTRLWRLLLLLPAAMPSARCSGLLNACLILLLTRLWPGIRGTSALPSVTIRTVAAGPPPLFAQDSSSASKGLYCNCIWLSLAVR